MTVIPGNAQHIGDREQQQDSFGFSNFEDHAFESHGGVMMVLCDGMGGLANGAAASRVAVDAVLSGYQRKESSEDIASALDRCISEAQQAVCTICNAGGGGGTTIVTAVICKDRLYWASLGDSRLYLCRSNEPAVQLTRDHNVASLLERRAGHGDTAEIEAAQSANPEALTEYLGSPHRPQPDIDREGTPLHPGDRVLACSDGLYRSLSPAAMAAATRHADPMTAAERMISWVLEQKLPHQDNVTAVLLEVSPGSGPGRISSLVALGTGLFGISYRRHLDRMPKLPALGALSAAGVSFAAGVVLVNFGALDFRDFDQPRVASVPISQSECRVPVSRSGSPGAQSDGEHRISEGHSKWSPNSPRQANKGESG